MGFSCVSYGEFLLWLILVYMFLAEWLRKVIWYKRTGGIKSIPWKLSLALTSYRELTCFSLLWVLVSVILTKALTSVLIPGGQYHLLVFTVASAVILLVFVCIARRRTVTRLQPNPYWEEWRCATGSERALKIVSFSWPMTLTLFFQSGLIPPGFLFNINGWLVMPIFLLIVLGCRTMFTAVEALSTHPR